MLPDGDFVDFFYNGDSNKKNTVEFKCLDLTELSLIDFKQAIVGIIKDLKSKIHSTYEFRSNLTPEHRQIIYTYVLRMEFNI